jgi:sulfur relay (sulfurtransferase) DsrC/TusE family protein
LENIIEKYKEEIKKTDLKETLKKYVDFLISKKKISISINDFLEYQILIENNIIKSENNSLKIQNYTFIAITILEHFKTLYSFKYSSEFKDSIILFNRIKEDFIKDNYSSDYNILEVEFLKILIYENNKKLNLNFYDFINNLSKENDSEYIYEFIRAYSEILSFIDIDIEIMHQNSILLLEITKSDANYNIEETGILNGIKQKCFYDIFFGLKLFELSINKNSIEKNDSIISSIVSGLYEKIGYSFYETHLKKLTDRNKNLLEIINGLSDINNISDKEYTLFITLFNKYKTNKNLITVLAKVIFAILNSNSFLNNNTNTNKCFDCLNEILVNGDSLFFILQKIVYLENYDEKRVEILTNIIKQSEFSIENHLFYVVHFFRKIDNIRYLQQILVTISQSHPFKNIANHFNSRFEKFDKIEFDNMLIDFLTDNKANLRFLGIDLFKYLKYKKFNIDIIKLEPIKQYKLWVSLTQTYDEPKNIIPCLTPLLKSTSTTVKECFINKLKEYSENYGGHLTEVLENNLDIHNSNHNEILKLIIDYMHDYYDKNVYIKRNVKELNPYYSCNKILNNFNSSFNKKMRKGMNEGADTNSFFGFSKTIQLAKGGGWKFGDKNDIAKLAKIQTSMALPRNYFTDPNQYELEESQENSIDWKKNDFKIIEKWIENE